MPRCGGGPGAPAGPAQRLHPAAQDAQQRGLAPPAPSLASRAMWAAWRRSPVGQQERVMQMHDVQWLGAAAPCARPAAASGAGGGLARPRGLGPRSPGQLLQLGSARFVLHGLGAELVFAAFLLFCSSTPTTSSRCGQAWHVGPGLCSHAAEVLAARVLAGQPAAAAEQCRAAQCSVAEQRGAGAWLGRHEWQCQQAPQSVPTSSVGCGQGP